MLHVPSLALTTCDTECVPVNFRLDKTVINGCCRYGDCVCVHHINVSFLLCMFIKLYIYTVYVDVTLGRKCVYFSVKFEIAQIKEFKQM